MKLSKAIVLSALMLLVAKPADARDWGAEVPDSTIQVGDTIDWNGKKFKAVSQTGLGTLMLSQSSFGVCKWKEILDACSENGISSDTFGWYRGLNSVQKEAMKVMPKIECEQYGGNASYDGSITETKLFPLSYREAESIGPDRNIGEYYWTRTYAYYTDSGHYSYDAWCVDSVGDLYYDDDCSGWDNGGGVVPAFYLKESASACNHLNLRKAVQVAATCTANGTTRYTCANCGYHYDDQDIPALGHSWIWGGTADKHQVCSRCGATQGSHNYSSQITQQKTCTSDEITTYTCSCGYRYTAKTGAKLGHNENSRRCLGDGTDTLSCSRCGAEIRTVACTHKVCVTLDAITNGGAVVNPVTPFIGTPFTLPTASKLGWDFRGWATSPSAKAGQTGNTSVTTNATFYAIFSKLLTVNYNDASGTSKKEVTIYNDATSAKVILPQPSSLDGWTTVGWTQGGRDYLNANDEIIVTP